MSAKGQTLREDTNRVARHDRPGTPFTEMPLESRALIEAQDAERSRIARDLHDDVSQLLAGVSIGT